MMYQITILCNVDSSFGELLLIENDNEHLITETKTFYFSDETDVELICTPNSDEYEVVEVINSTNFSMHKSSVHHYIKVNKEQEVHPIFRKKPKVGITELGQLRLNMNDGGVVKLSGEHQDFVQSNQGTFTYPIHRKSLIDVDIKPKDGYGISYIKSNYEKYQIGGEVLFDESDAWIDLRFEPTLPVPEDTNKFITSDDETEMQSRLITNTQKDSLFVENIIKKQPIGDYKPTTPPVLPKNISTIFEFDFHAQTKESTESQFSCNGNSLHNIILYRGETYQFKTLHDRASFELLETTYELFSDDNITDPNFTLNADLTFTPNQNTPNKLLLRTKYKKDRTIAVSVMNNHFFGTASSSSFLKNTKVDTASDDPTITNKFGEIIINGRPTLDSLNASTGIDQVTNIQNKLTYKSPRGSTQINALTTLFSTLYDTGECDVYEINLAFSNSLAYNSDQNILVENIVQNIINGDSSYFNLHKILILVDALLNIGNKLGDFDQFKIKLASRFLKDRLVLFNGDEFLNETIGDLVDYNVEIIDIIRNLFSFVINTDVESSYYSWYKLFAFHYVFHEKYLSVIDDEDSLMAQWNQFSDNLQMSFSELNKINIPSELVLSECIECRIGTENFNTLHDVMKLSLDEESFNLILLNKMNYSENTYKYVIGKTLQISYLDETSCYEVKPHSVNYYDTLRSADTFNLNYDYGSMDMCLENLLTTDNPTDEEIPTEENTLFEFSMIESGDSTVMLNYLVTDENILIESLGKNEYRIYVDEKIGEPETIRTSPGYIKIPKDFAINMQQHYIRIGYQSGVEKKSVVDAVDNEKQIRIVTTYWSRKLHKLVCITQYPINANNNDTLEFLNASIDALNGVFQIAEIITSTAFTIDLNITDNFDEYADISADVIVKSGVRVYCDTRNFEIGDPVLFSNHKNFPTLIKNISADDFGDYIEVNDEFKNIPRYVVKSHAIDNRDEVVDFMFTQKQIYYETTKSDYLDDRVWLTYDPDPNPHGRLNQKVSYIQIFYNKDF
jgi:hypothetical protein